MFCSIKLTLQKYQELYNKFLAKPQYTIYNKTNALKGINQYYSI
mgnify:CR=1